MTKNPKDDPGNRLRKLVGSSSPASRLPKKNAESLAGLPQLDPQKQFDEEPAAPSTANLPLAAASLSTPPPVPDSNIFRRIFGPTLWNIASVVSLSVNLVLVLVLLVLAIGLLRNGLSPVSMLNMGSSLLGGLYGNFEKMDRAHITTDIPVNTTIPVQFDLRINQQSNVVLSQDVTINNVLVTINTGGLNISGAAATIVLPQGAVLPINLDLTFPVSTTIPVTLNIPVDIPLNTSQLHQPFIGLQEVVKPIYCIVDSNAKNLDGNLICK